METSLPRRLVLTNSQDLTAAFNSLQGFPAVREPVLIDASRVSFVEPAGLALLSSLLRLLLEEKEEDAEVTWLPPSNQDVSNYLARMDFLRTFGVNVPHHRRAAAGRFAELQPVSTATEYVSNVVTRRLCDVVRSNWHASDDAVALMSYGLGECVDNIVAHSMSPVGGFACAQCYPLRGAMQFAVSDTGIGIRRSLERTHGPTDDAHAIEMAVRKHVTSKAEGHAGEGLYVISEMVQANGGLLVIHSGEAKYTVDSSKGTACTVTVPFLSGTLVGIDVTLDPGRKLGDLVNSLFPEDAPDDWLDWSVSGGNGDDANS